MSTDALNSQLERLCVSDSENLPFEPPADLVPSELGPIPRYLFRVFSPKSAGDTNAAWAISEDAHLRKDSQHIDIFAIGNRRQAGYLVDGHLRWRNYPQDNLVSWTSSALLALAYIFYRHHHLSDQSPLAEIFIVMIDTSRFDSNVFIQDMDLINAYASYNESLEDFRDLRVNRRKNHEYYYFGEYLSQGKLKIEGTSRLISAKALVEAGLPTVLPDLQSSADPQPPPWASKVLGLRETIFRDPVARDIDSTKVQAVMKIAELFGDPWKLPIASNLLALIPHRREHSGVVIHVLAGCHPTDDEFENCSDSKTKIITYESLPEVERFSEIMRGVYHYFCLSKVEKHIREARQELHSAMVVHGQISSTDYGREVLAARLIPILQELAEVDHSTSDLGLVLQF